MPPTHLRSVDLNLLVALDALLRERHVTRAGAQLGLTQSGMSHALSRLRELFDDPLLVPAGGGLQTTARADELRGPLSQVLREIRVLLEAPTFEARLATGEFRMSMPDHLALLLAPPLLARLGDQAPGIDLVITSFSSDWPRTVLDGEVEMALVEFTVGPDGSENVGLRSRILVDDSWCVLLRKGHPALDERWCVDTFAQLNHAMMTIPGSGLGQVDEALAAIGLTRRVVYKASSPLLVALAVAETDLVCTTSALLGSWLADRLGLCTRPIPVAPRRLRMQLVWDERNHRDPRHRWLREQLQQVAAPLGVRQA